MEILKKTVLLFTLIVLVGTTSAQTQTSIEKAFAKSYELEQTEKYSTAINELKTVYSNNSYFVNIRLGWLYYLNKQYTESLHYYNIAVTLKPYAIEARFGSVKPLSAIEDWNKVRDQYLSILKIDPQNTLANYWLGVIYYNKKDYVHAVKLFEKVVNLYPLDYDSIIMLAWTKLWLNNTVEAKVLFNQALVIRPNDNSALTGLKRIR